MKLRLKYNLKTTRNGQDPNIEKNYSMVFRYTHYISVIETGKIKTKDFIGMYYTGT